MLNVNLIANVRYALIKFSNKFLLFLAVQHAPAHYAPTHYAPAHYAQAHYAAEPAHYAAAPAVHYSDYSDSYDGQYYEPQQHAYSHY